MIDRRKAKGKRKKEKGKSGQRLSKIGIYSETRREKWLAKRGFLLFSTKTVDIFAGIGYLYSQV
ncbi:MAG: hypothetical protein NTV54_14205 [Ignavibacteriales bacterium]|nr:hypothetical protein [Ignavibacteriales bacterium]